MPLTPEQEQELVELRELAAKMAPSVAAAADREMIMRSSITAGIVGGSNVFDQQAGKYPWMPLQEQMANYWDLKVDLKKIPKPIKPIAVARGHLKTEVGCYGMARHIANNPESRNGIIGATSDRAESNLANIIQIVKSDRYQAAFPDRFYTPDDRMNYTKEKLIVKRRGAYREATITAGGVDANWAGTHFGEGSILWIDDIVNKQNCTTSEQKAKIWEALAHIIQFICDAGCTIVPTFTRYAHDDAYSYLLDPASDWAQYIVPGAINYGCWTKNKDGILEPHYPMKYCVKKDEIPYPVFFRGVEYNPPRESLEEKKKMSIPSEWAAQMENNPQPDDAVVFRESYFDSVLPVDGHMLADWLNGEGNIREHLTKDPAQVDRGNLIPVIVGDPSYERNSNNDWQVLMLILQDNWGHWYVCEAHRKREGWQGLENYLRTALRWQQQYRVSLPWGIESHSKEAIKSTADIISRLEGVPITFANLKKNTNISKQTRMGALEPQFRNKMVHFCQNVNWFRELACREMVTFGGGQSHDDIGDTFANAPQVLPPRSGGNSHGLIDLEPGARRYKTLRFC